MEQKKLLESQKELLRMKRQEIDKALEMARQKEFEFVGALNMIGIELGIEKDQLGKWELTEDGNCLRIKEESSLNHKELIKEAE